MEQKIMQEWIKEGQLSISQVLLANYKVLSLNETEMMLLIQIESYRAAGNPFPSVEELTIRMTLSQGEIMKLIETLIARGFLALTHHEERQILTEAYSLEPLWEKLWLLYEEKDLTGRINQQVKEETNLYRLFESEFGRPLSPIEAETLSAWLDQDHVAPDLVKEALKEAVISSKLSFRYIDRILLNWTKEGVKTVEDARKIAENFHQNGSKEAGSKTQGAFKQSSDSIPFYDWLEKRKG
ncbi:DnaD domain-containing protein [Listeria ilorinensis]|uniref:DnaD domain-containing protein n=1 Tax=Listeria ilorinensis TaxID=2867439 RepID=UPI001EF6BA69|nr:DnaD domain-containing protein [Listeria ilorinensis]